MEPDFQVWMHSNYSAYFMASSPIRGYNEITMIKLLYSGSLTSAFGIIAKNAELLLRLSFGHEFVTCMGVRGLAPAAAKPDTQRPSERSPTARQSAAATERKDDARTGNSCKGRGSPCHLPCFTLLLGSWGCGVVGVLSTQGTGIQQK